MKLCSTLRMAVGAICTAGILAAAGAASAATIDITREFGLIKPGDPADATAATERIEYVVGQYNLGAFGSTSGVSIGTHGPYTVDVINLGITPLPSVGEIGLNQSPFPPNTTSLTVDLGLGGYDYLAAKWANTEVFYYIAGLTGEVTLMNDVVKNQAGAPQGLSGLITWGPGTSKVPDAASTAALLGMALVGIGTLRNKFSKN